MPNNNPHNCQIITGYQDLTAKEADEFWAQGVCMDDWDYMILVENPDEVLATYQESDEEPGEEQTRYTPKVYDFDRMLVGCCSNVWYRAKFRGKEYAIGVAYHA